MNRSAIRDLARTLLSEPTPSYWSNTELDNWLNYGMEDFCNQTEVLEGIYTLSTVQYQADYSWPSNTIKIKRLELVKGNSAYALYNEDLDEHFTGIVKTTSSPPQGANVFADLIRLRERPSAAAASTTLNGAISSTTATSITLTSGASFPRTGRIIVDSEVIEYWNNSSNVLSPCARGAEGTTAATHLTAATVTLRDVYVYSIRRNGDISSDLSSPSFPTQFHPAMAHYIAWLGRIKHKDYDLAQQNKAIYDNYVLQGLDYTKFKWKKQGGFSPK